MIGAIVAVEDRPMKDIGHVGRQESVFLATEFIIKTSMKQIADMLHEFRLALTEDSLLVLTKNASL